MLWTPTLYKCGIKGKLYRLWYELYKDSQIKVKTAAGLTNVKLTGENVTQGSAGAIVNLVTETKGWRQLHFKMTPVD